MSSVFETLAHCQPITYRTTPGDSTDPTPVDMRAHWPELAFDVRVIGRRNMTPAGVRPYAPHGYARAIAPDAPVVPVPALTATEKETRKRAMDATRARFDAEREREALAAYAVHVARMASEPQTEEEKEQARAELRASLKRAKEQNSHVPTPDPIMQRLRHACTACARKMVDAASAKGSAYALPVDEEKRARALQSIPGTSGHRKTGHRLPKAWDYMVPELAEEMFSAFLAHVRPHVANLTPEHDARYVWTCALGNPHVWVLAMRDAQKLFGRMARAPKVELEKAEHVPDGNEETTTRDARDMTDLAECLSAFYLARSPRNAETLLRADLEAVRALSSGELKLDAKGHTFARFIRLAKRAEEGALLLNRSRVPVRPSDYRRESPTRVARMTV